MVVLDNTDDTPYIYDLSLSYNEHFIITKAHPGEVIDVMKSLALTIDLSMGMVLKLKFFVFKEVSIHFNLTTILAEYLQQDTMISFEVFINSDSSFYGGISEMTMIIILAAYTTESLP